MHMLVMDPDPATAALLMADVQAQGFSQVTHIADASGLAQAVAGNTPDIVIFNYHFDRPDSLESCGLIRLIAPHTAILAIASAGPAIKRLRSWSRDSGALDVILEKPYLTQRFRAALGDLVQGKQASRAMEVKAALLENLLPEEALTAIDRNATDEVEIFEGTVLFTDIRRSSEMITHMPPREFFSQLNQTLSIQAKLVRDYEGSVIKFTGDGVLAVFRGMGKSYLALRCAVELAGNSCQQIFPYGIGVAGGLIMAGLVGDSGRAGQKQQYDVIGASVHLAARLCNMANAREVIATQQAYAAARFSHPVTRAIGRVSIRGFDAGVDCVALNPSPETTVTATGT
ncbi:adenylate/guanylate cyclase domain-containing protein [Polaromonas sp.]|uniref:adenylate/guanylate cyclase domain-containing protein n=1 Tax=Polaromonas sp. TaxID=1869339 RepID=UPI003752A3F3